MKKEGEKTMYIIECHFLHVTPSKKVKIYANNETQKNEIVKMILNNSETIILIDDIKKCNLFLRLGGRLKTPPANY